MPPTRIPLAFLPTGEMDMTHTLPSDLTQATELLAPTIQVVRDISGDDSFDIFTLLSWTFLSYYWILLADLGQIAPTAYDITVPNNPHPVPFSSNHNIFVNTTLFETYFQYFNRTIIPLSQKLGFNPPNPVILNNDNRLTSVETTLLRSYSCSKRQAKSPVSLIVSVITADYAFIIGGYQLILYITGWFQRRKDDGKFT
jgi:hypothetical protein